MKKYVIVDVDGTVATNAMRQFAITERLKDTPIDEMPWNDLFEGCENDSPIEPVIGLVKKLSDHYHIVWCTSRNVVFRDRTREWLDRYTGLWRAPLLMRKSPDDHRSDTIVKPELLEEAGITVQAWRDLGFTVLQPAANEY
jgi:hypothetical protein